MLCATSRAVKAWARWSSRSATMIVKLASSLESQESGSASGLARKSQTVTPTVAYFLSDLEADDDDDSNLEAWGRAGRKELEFTWHTGGCPCWEMRVGLRRRGRPTPETQPFEHPFGIFGA